MPWLTGNPSEATGTVSTVRRAVCSAGGQLVTGPCLLGRQPGLCGAGMEWRGADPQYWLREQYYERLMTRRYGPGWGRVVEIDRVVVGLLGRLGASVRRRPREEVERVVREWAGSLSGYVSVGLRRARGRTVLTILVSHPAVAMELRGRVARLRGQLGRYGVTDVTMRIGDRYESG